MTEQTKRFQLTHQGDGHNTVLIDGIDVTHLVRDVHIDTNWRCAEVTLTLSRGVYEVDLQDATIKVNTDE